MSDKNVHKYERNDLETIDIKPKKNEIYNIVRHQRRWHEYAQDLLF